MTRNKCFLMTHGKFIVLLLLLLNTIIPTRQTLNRMQMNP